MFQFPQLFPEGNTIGPGKALLSSCMHLAYQCALKPQSYALIWLGTSSYTKGRGKVLSISLSVRKCFNQGIMQRKIAKIVHVKKRTNPVLGISTKSDHFFYQIMKSDDRILSALRNTLQYYVDIFGQFLVNTLQRLRYVP